MVCTCILISWVSAVGSEAFCIGKGGHSLNDEMFHLLLRDNHADNADYADYAHCADMLR